MVRTPASHVGNTGSNPVGTTTLGATKPRQEAFGRACGFLFRLFAFAGYSVDKDPLSGLAFIRDLLSVVPLDPLAECRTVHQRLLLHAS